MTAVGGREVTRREVLKMLAACVMPVGAERTQRPATLTRPIPSSDERLPVVGLGSWITFNVGDDAEARDDCAAVIREFVARGGRLIDSSPMYGSSQSVIGHGIATVPDASRIFAADKVWTSSGREGPAQVEESRRRWRVRRFDLLQVHNLDAWESHLPMLLAMKSAGRVRYVGVTTSHGRRSEEMERVMRSQPLDLVQITYNLVDREAESRLLPLALDRGIGVIINRPFRGGGLLQVLERHPLPPWAAEIDCTAWSQFALKYIVSHPAVTCAIPATSRLAHLRENMKACTGRLPDAPMRLRMQRYVASL